MLVSDSVLFSFRFLCFFSTHPLHPPRLQAKWWATTLVWSSTTSKRESWRSADSCPASHPASLVTCRASGTQCTLLLWSFLELKQQGSQPYVDVVLVTWQFLKRHFDDEDSDLSLEMSSQTRPIHKTVKLKQVVSLRNYNFLTSQLRNGWLIIDSGSKYVWFSL